MTLFIVVVLLLSVIGLPWWILLWRKHVVKNVKVWWKDVKSSWTAEV